MFSDDPAFSDNPARVRIGISSCLLGERVRYDGNHKRQDYLIETWGRYVEFVPVCPEVGIGLGVPRPPIRLVGDRARPRAVGVRDATLDVTAPLEAYARARARQFDDLSGHIFKSKSPSCGLARVPVYAGDKAARRAGRGVYARVVTDAHPLLPVEEEGRLNDPELRDNFIERVFAYRRWRALGPRVTAARIVAFHTAHKLVLMAHGAAQARALGQLVADVRPANAKRIGADYAQAFMQALARRATRKTHANVLMHVMGYRKRELSADDKAELLALIDAYRLGHVPLLAPLTLLRHHLRHHPDPFLARQLYLYPDPHELMLRSAA